MNKKHLVKSLLSGLLLLIATSIVVGQSGLAHAATQPDRTTIHITIEPDNLASSTPQVLVRPVEIHDAGNTYAQFYDICKADNPNMKSRRCEESPGTFMNIYYELVDHASSDGRYAETTIYYQATIRTTDAGVIGSNVYKLQVHSDGSVTIEDLGYNNNKISDDDQLSMNDNQYIEGDAIDA